MWRVRRGSKLLDRETLLPQKRIQAPDTRREEIKILDSCSRSQIHLWSKSQILRLLALAERLGPKVNPLPPHVDRLGLPARSAVSCNIHCGTAAQEVTARVDFAQLNSPTSPATSGTTSAAVSAPTRTNCTAQAFNSGCLESGQLAE